MIAASEPQEFIPFGRTYMQRHPGENVLPSDKPHLQTETFLSHRLSQVAISGEPKQPSEIWKTRWVDEGYEEELYASGKTAVWSRGGVNGGNKMSIISFSAENKLNYALWCTFHAVSFDKVGTFNSPSDPEDNSIPSVCIIDSENIQTFTEDGDDYITSLQFQLLNVWPSKYGLLLERSRTITSTPRTDYQEPLEDSLPLLFSLIHPLDDTAPVLIKQNKLSTQKDPCIQVVFVSEEPSICMMFDSRSGLHSVWKIRKTDFEEGTIYLGYQENSFQSICSSINYPSIGSPSPSSSINRLSLGARSSGLFGALSPASSAHNSPRLSTSRCSSPLAESPRSAAFRPLLNPLMDSRLGMSQVLDMPYNVAKPLFPDVCLEHVWTESKCIRREGGSSAASRVFLSTDLVGQTYLCYLVESCNQLFCSRLEKTSNEQQIIFGIVSCITAKDAVPIPHLNMIATIDLMGYIVLYLGMTVVGKVHLGGISSALATSLYLSKKYCAHFSSPFPRRSTTSSIAMADSIVSSTPLRPVFSEDMELLSPVVDSQAFRNNLFRDEGGSTESQGQMIGFRDSAANRVTLEYSDGRLFHTNLPKLCSSTLVFNCLHVLKHVLQKDIAIQLLARWYAARNAPGTQDIPPSQEWHLFMSTLLELFGYEVDKLPVMHQDVDPCLATPIAQPKKKRADSGSQEDWEYLLSSEHHRALSEGMSSLLGLHCMPPIPRDSKPSVPGHINSSAMLFPSMPLIFFALHLHYEELKLNLLQSDSLSMLAQLIHQLAGDLHLENYLHHYWTDFPMLCPLYPRMASQVSDADLKKLTFPVFITTDPPHIFKQIYCLIKNIKVPPYPYIREVNKRTRDIIQLSALITYGSKQNLQLEGFVRPVVPAGSRGESQEALSARDIGNSSSYTFPYRFVLLMAEMGITRRILETLPAGISLLFNSVLYCCRENPPSDWPESAYHLILREDLAAQCLKSKVPNDELYPKSTTVEKTLGYEPDDRKASSRPIETELDDGMDSIESEILKLRFNKDQRVAEVRRLLQSSQPVKVAIPQRPEVSDHDFIEEQERHLYALCSRTMALPVGRGMFTLRSTAPVITETLPIPRLCLTGRAPPRGTTVDLSHIEVVPNMNLWPLFHNGVAAGLRIIPSASDIESAWIVFNKPKGTSEVLTEHAGFLMALGLNGHLSSLEKWNIFEYLIKCHEMTSVGLLLGIAATRRGTMDVLTTKMMSLHVEALLPPTSIEMDIQQNVQVASLLGVGLLYEGTAHRRMAEVLLDEIGRPPGPEMENCVDRESYSLSAGLALGLVVLGKGSDLVGLNDLAIPDTLHYYMVGGHRRPLTGSQKEKYKSPSYQIREGDSVNIDVTSPGATLALGMLFFNTGNRAVADWMKAPDTQYLLDFVQPDFLLLRIVSRSLILWDTIIPSRAWVESNVPAIIKQYCLVKPKMNIPDGSAESTIDYETMNQAYCNIVAGACMALGLKFAGSANNEAFLTLLKYAKMFTSLSGRSIAELAGKSTIETCLNVILLALAMVMAGTGDLEVIRLCRHLRTRVGPSNSVVTYGSHLATHMALGLLFLGGGRYTLATSPSAVAAMLCAFFPKFPTHSNDNRYHLQAFRHLYVLAVQPRLLVPQEIDTRKLCYVHLTVVYLDTAHYKNQTDRLRAPCMLPELSLLKEVRVDDERYWKIVFERSKNWDQLESLLENGGFMKVKKRAGCLSYTDDPHGFRSLIAQNLTCGKTIPWSVQNYIMLVLQVHIQRCLQDECSSMSTSKIIHFKSKTVDWINAVTSDMSMLTFTQYFLQQDGSLNLPIENQQMQLFTALVYECVTYDKLAIVPVWIALLKALQNLSTCPNPLLLWQLKLAIAQVKAQSTLQAENPMLIDNDMAVCLDNHVLCQLDSWEPEMMLLLKQYFTGNLTTTSMNLRKLTTFLVYFDFPILPRLLPSVEGVDDPIGLLFKLKDLNLQEKTIQKIWRVLSH